MGELNTMSINFLDPEKCKFYLNPNGFAALKTEDKDYRRVRLLRTLPLHRPPPGGGSPHPGPAPPGAIIPAPAICKKTR